jgi:hypothetical protein
MRAGNPVLAASGRTVRLVWRAPTITWPFVLLFVRAVLAAFNGNSRFSPRITVAAPAVPTLPHDAATLRLPRFIM